MCTALELQPITKYLVRGYLDQSIMGSPTFEPMDKCFKIAIACISLAIKVKTIITQFMEPRECSEAYPAQNLYKLAEIEITDSECLQLSLRVMN